MNKKAYQQPTMNVVKIQHKSHILTASVNRVSSDDVDLDYGGGASVDANSRSNRGFDVWDDWDDEE